MASGFEKFDKFVLDECCPAKAFEEVDVTVPVEVRAFSKVRDVELKCMGPATVKKCCEETPGCPGAVSKFTICQKMRVEVPVEFTAECSVGQGHVCFDHHVDARGFDHCGCECEHEHDCECEHKHDCERERKDDCGCERKDDIESFGSERDCDCNCRRGEHGHRRGR